MVNARVRRDRDGDLVLLLGLGHVGGTGSNCHSSVLGLEEPEELYGVDPC